MPATSATIVNVLTRYAHWLQTQPHEIRAAAAEALNVHLDDMLHGDAFGTEGQCDPRGDHRG